MRNAISSIISLFLILILIYFSFARLRPDANYSQSGFDMQRAFSHVEQIGQTAHPIGTARHGFVKNYIVQQLQKLGLEVQTQEGYSLNDGGILVKPINIITRIPGTDPSAKALVLMSHYDSSPHSAKGASDAGSGVATILEATRAFLSNRTAHTNDIIILFTDAEELGLNGAELFVNKHEWAKDVGLVLNFEARGSGGPSNMIVETNGGNSSLIKAFADAKVDFPVATSLMYSVYKMLPNDTDSTVFREDGNINSFFFAFIADHFDYHTVLDSPERLDKKSLAHQASYLVPSLKYFSNINLENLNSEGDDVYFDLPLATIVHYSFKWNIPLVVFASAIFILLLIYGYRKKQLTTKGLFKSFVPFLIVLILAPLLTFLGWKLITVLYPQYGEILQNFTYNGHTYIAAFVLLTLAILWLVYGTIGKRLSVPELLVAPLTFWLLSCLVLAFVLPGASYFIIPVLFGLLSFSLCLARLKPMLLLLVLINAGAIFIFVPLIQSFPVGLGLEMLFISAFFTVLLFGLLLSIFGFYKRKIFLGYACLILSLGFFIWADFNSGFNEERPKPNSLVYSFDQQSLKAHWYTYDKVLDDWTREVLGENPSVYVNDNTFSSKYNSAYTYYKPAAPTGVPEPSILIKKNDTSSTSTTRYSIKIAPNRALNRMELYTTDTKNFTSFEVAGLKTNDIIIHDKAYNKHTKRWSNHVLSYYMTDMDTLRIEVETSKDYIPEFVLYEASNNLMTNPEVPVPQRKHAQIPKPFVLNDAIISKSVINLSDWNFNVPKTVNLYE